jgi:L-lactate dehydrogenase complex protein LldG
VNREAFLKRVQKAAEAGRAHRVSVADRVGSVGYIGARGALHEQFAAEVQANGGTAHVVDCIDAAQRELISLVKQAAAASALCWRAAILDRLGIATLLSDQNVTYHDVETLSQLAPDARREAMLSAEIGITGADLAIAETGSLVVGSRPGKERVASLLPPFHVAVIEQAQIVPDLFDVFDRLGQQGREALPSNLVFVSGPSKTGDIELQLTTGVHGPGHWHVIVLADKATPT